jgi:hypothetical protein
MRAPTSARGLLLAAACISTLQGGCSWSSGGPPPGYDPNRSAGMKPAGQSPQPQQASYSKPTQSGPVQSGPVQSGPVQSGPVQSGNVGSQVKADGVAGCMSITEDQVPVNYFETVGVATAAGGILLALLGAGAGALMSEDRGRGAANGAIIGGVAGLGLGAVSGVQTAEQKKHYAVQLARYDCQLEAARTENASLAAASERLQASVDTLTGQLDQLEDDYANKRLTKAQAQEELADIDASAAGLKTRLVAMKADTDQYQQYAAQTQQMAQGTRKAIDEARVDELDRQIADMRDRNEQLEREYNELVERRKAVVLQ